MFPAPDKDTVKFVKGHFGDKTINDIRSEAGIGPVEGGDVPYWKWLSETFSIPLKPDLKIVPNLS